MTFELYHQHDEEAVELLFMSRSVDVSDNVIVLRFYCPECKQVVDLQLY